VHVATSADDLLAAAETLRNTSERLLLLVGPPGSGKTRLLRQAEEENALPSVTLGITLTRRLLDVRERNRPLAVSRLLAEILDDLGKGPILIDNIEVLFQPELEQDPLHTLRSLARTRTLIVAWPGILTSDGALTYAELGHPEYRCYRPPGVLCLTMPGTG